MKMEMGMGKHVLSFSLLWRKKESKGAKKRLCNCQNDSHFRLCGGEAPLLSIRNTFRSPSPNVGEARRGVVDTVNWPLSVLAPASEAFDLLLIKP